jgi:predicted nucleotidyltransferase
MSVEGFELGRRLIRHRKEKDFLRRENLRKETLKGTIAALKRYFRGGDVEAVYLIGSLLHEGKFYEFSDVDVAVKGFKGDVWELGCELERVLNRDVDVIVLEKSSLKDFVERYGLRVI